MNRISILINEVCRSLGMSYRSKNLEEARKKNLMDKIFKLYTTIDEIIVELSEAEENYKDNKELVDLLEEIIRKLSNVDHDLIKKVTHLIKKEKHGKH